MIQNDKPNVHQHQFFSRSYDPYARYCECGKIKVSDEVLKHRVETWEAYYIACRMTPAYENYLSKVEAYKHKDFTRMEELEIERQSFCHLAKNEWGEDVWELDDPLPKPPFPDPSTGRYIV